MKHLYSALYIAVHPKRFTIVGGGGGGLSLTTTSVQHPLGSNHHTPATGGEERES